MAEKTLQKQSKLITLLPKQHDIAPDLTIINSARTSFLGASKGAEQDRKLLQYLFKHEHSTPFEMVEYLFSASLPSDEFRSLIDPRFRVTVVPAEPNIPDQYFVRIDLNNAIKYLRYYPNTAFGNLLKDTIIVHNAWTADCMGLISVPTSVVKYSAHADSVSRVNVLDKGWVEVQDFSGSDSEILRIWMTMTQRSYRSVEDGIRDMFQQDDLRPLLLYSMKLRIHAPVVVWWQLVRHRSFTMNLQSGRYTPFEEDSFYLPTEWRKQSTSNKQGSDGLVAELGQLRFTTEFKKFVDAGFHHYSEALRYGVAKEQSRLFLPAWASYYTGIVKSDLFNLGHFLRLRLDSHAQHEIRVYAESIYEEWVRVMPVTAHFFAEYRSQF